MLNKTRGRCKRGIAMSEGVLKCISKKKYNLFQEILLKYQSVLRERHIVLWGAGTMGIQFSMVLKKNYQYQMSFCDNDPQKWGEKICGIGVLSPKVLEGKNEEYFVFLAIEEAPECAEQIGQMGFRYQLDWCDVDAIIRERFVQEFYKRTDAKWLFFGDCVAENVCIDDIEEDAIEQKVEKYSNAKVISLNGFYIQTYYHILKTLLIHMSQLKKVVFLLDISSFEPHMHLAKANQHVTLMTDLLNKDGKLQEEQRDYLNLIHKRTQFSPCQGFSVSRKEGVSKQLVDINKKIYTNINYMYTWDETSENVIYMKKIFQICKQCGIELFFIALPVNFKLAQRYFFKTFNDKYDMIIRHLKHLIVSNDGVFVDLSFLLPEEDFISIRNISEGIDAQGRKLVFKEIEFALNFLGDIQ